MVTVAILGTVGVPARYGGFETLAENLVLHNAEANISHDLEVYCSAKAYPERISVFKGASLRYLSLDANGKQAMFYDMWSLIDSALRGTDVVILLGHGGSFIIPVLKLFSKTKFITNIDGIEWRREKWTGLARWIIRKSEAMAVKHSHIVVADNEAIREYVASEFGEDCKVIPYGGDHAIQMDAVEIPGVDLPEVYALGLCRIEPENNVGMILEAFSQMPEKPLVFVGNWENSEYGRALRQRFGGMANIRLLDPVYDPGNLRWLRDRACAYIHGHSAGGTNPSLVEMMHFGIPVFAHGCDFNRYSTENSAVYFETPAELVAAVRGLEAGRAREIGGAMREIAQRRYTWEQVGRAYFALMQRA